MIRSPGENSGLGGVGRDPECLLVIDVVVVLLLSGDIALVLGIGFELLGCSANSVI